MPSRLHIELGNASTADKIQKGRIAFSREVRGHLKGIAAALERLRKKQANGSVP